MKKNTSPDRFQKPFLEVKDHAVSGRVFELYEDEERERLFTFPVPTPEELPKFYNSKEYISHSDSRETFFDKVYQNVKGWMLLKKVQWIEKQQKGKGNILDVGAGTGDFLLEAEKSGWNIYGMEPGSTARERAAIKGVSLRPNLDGFPNDFFDAITLWHVLEHIADLEEHLLQLLPLLKKDGLLVVAVPNFKSYDANFYKQYWAAYDVPRHLHHFSRSSVRSLFSRFHFEVVKEKGLPFDSYYVSLLSEKYKRGLSFFVRALWIGLLSNLKARHTGEYSSVAYFLRRR